MKDVRVAFRALGFKLKRDEVNKMIEDANLKDQALTLQDFTNLVGPRVAKRNAQDEIKLAFAYIAKIDTSVEGRKLDAKTRPNPLLAIDESTN